MFEDYDWDAAWLAERVAVLDLIDEADVLDDDVWSLTLSPEDVSHLEGPRDLAGAEGGDLVEEAVKWTRMANIAQAHVVDAVAELVRRTHPAPWLDAETQVAAEIGAALALGTGAAAHLVDTSLTLTTTLTNTHAAMHAGDVSWLKATTLATAVAGLSDDGAREVEARVLPCAATRTPAQHRAAVQRWVDRIDPDGADRRRRQARRDIRLIRTHHGAGMGELFASMTSEDLDMTWTAADTWARRAKAAGDDRTLDQLRVAALVRWAERFLTGRDDEPGSPPTRHGNPVRMHVLWDIDSLLGRADHCAELADSGATLPPEAMRELLGRGARVRRLLVDPDTGELLDLTPVAWTIAPTDADAPLPPVVLDLVVDTDTRERLLRDAAAVDNNMLRELLAHPTTAASLDTEADSYEPKPTLAEFVSARDRHPTNPTAGLTAATAADIDHVEPFAAGGRTVRDNLTTPTRRWHLLKTHGGWRVRRVGRSWQWISPAGRAYATHPHDYRLGP